MTTAPLFGSFFLGGFEGSTMKFPDGRRVDVSLASGHVARAAEDYALLAEAGIRCVRDSLAWHRIERQPGLYDWSQVRLMQRAAGRAGVRVIWDISHYGWPDHLDFWSDAFIARFADFAEEAARTIRQETDEVPAWVPVNEISFWTWAADKRFFEPTPVREPERVKRRLASAAIAAIQRLKAVDPRARMLLADPVIHVVADPDRPETVQAAAGYREAMYESWDMIAGRRAPELGGAEAYLDLVGVNYYPHNQWLCGGKWLRPGHVLRRPLPDLLEDVWRRYRRPLVIAETGTEGAEAFPWLDQIGRDVAEARNRGVPVEGICVYPVMDYPGWADDRHCYCGLIGVDTHWSSRHLRSDMAELLRHHERLLTSAGAPEGVCA